MGFDRYAYVSNNPIKFIDPTGHEKVVIIYGDNDTDSFKAAAQTRYKEALAQGYTKDEIYMVEVSTEKEFFAAIEHNRDGEIENLSIFSHGWGIDRDGTPSGGLQLSIPPKDEQDDDPYDIQVEDLSSKYASKFTQNAKVDINACNTARGTFPQEMANTWGVTVSASNKEMKFFMITIPSPIMVKKPAS